MYWGQEILPRPIDIPFREDFEVRPPARHCRNCGDEIEHGDTCDLCQEALDQDRERCPRCGGYWYCYCK